MRSVFILIILSLFISNIFAENTVEFHFSNGLKLIVQSDHRAPVVFTSVWYKVGGSDEPNGETGISHMLEHMMFKGTHQFGPGTFNKIIGDNGGENNAVTTEDYTMYYETTSPNQLDHVFQLEADRMRHLLLDSAAFDNERKVVMEERRMRIDDNPQAVTYERFCAAAFVNSPYHHPVIGWMTDIAHYTLPDLKKWYDTYYVPNNAVIVVVGDVNPNTVFSMAKKYFTQIKPGTIPQQKPRKEIESLGEKTVVVHLPSQLPWIIMGYHVPPTSYTLLVLANILGGGQSARLTNDLVRQNAIAVEADAEYHFYHLHGTQFIFSGTPAPKYTVLQLKKSILDEIHQLQTTRVSQDELNRVKTQLIASRIYKNDSLMQQANELGKPEMIGQSWKENKYFAEKIQLVTPEDIQAAARDYFRKNNLTVAILEPR